MWIMSACICFYCYNDKLNWMYFAGYLTGHQQTVFCRPYCPQKKGAYTYFISCILPVSVFWLPSLNFLWFFVFFLALVRAKIIAMIDPVSLLQFYYEFRARQRQNWWLKLKSIQNDLQNKLWSNLGPEVNESV